MRNSQREAENRLAAYWALETAALASGFGSRADVKSASADWLTVAESPDSLVALTDLSGDETTDEVLALTRPLYEELGLRFDDDETVGLLASARWLAARRRLGSERVAHALASLAINFSTLENDLVDATLASSALDEGRPEAAETDARLDLSRDAVVAGVKMGRLQKELREAITILLSEEPR